jgi:hypothetical protein
VRKWISLGLLEEDFLKYVLTPFRYVLYASKRDAMLMGRPKINNKTVGLRTIFFDRSSGFFKRALDQFISEPSKMTSLNTPLEIKIPLTAELAIFDSLNSVSIFIDPDVAPAVAVLSQSPSLEAMISVCELFRSPHANFYDLILDLMKTLENLNLVTIWNADDI